MSKKLIHVVSFILVLSLVLKSVTNAADPDLVGWWKLDDGSGTTAIEVPATATTAPLKAARSGKRLVTILK